MKKLFLLLTAAFFIFTSCNKNDNNPINNADNFVGIYTVKEIAKDLWTKQLYGNDVFNTSITKDTAQWVRIHEEKYRPWSIDGMPAQVITADSFSFHTLKGKRYGNDSMIVTYYYGLGGTTIDVRQVWTKN